MKYLIALVFALASIAAQAELPKAGGFTAAPDSFLLGKGQPWYYTTQVAPSPAPLLHRAPTSDEKWVVDKAQSMLANSSAKGMALIDGRNVVWVGFKAPASTSSTFFGYSMGKTVTSMAIGKAICQGKLSMETPASQLVPELRGTDLGMATVYDLLRMSSGTWEGNADTTIWSAEQIAALEAKQMSFVDLLATKKVSEAETNFFGQKRKPGENFAYHSTDPLVLGVMLNRATGMTYAKWVEQQVLIPSGIATPAIIGQDWFQYGQADGAVRMTMDDWIRFAVWLKDSEGEPGCFGDYVRAARKTQIANRSKKVGYYFDGYGYLIWTENKRLRDSYWAVGYGGQRIAWNHRNGRMLVVFSNVENYMDDLYYLYADWAKLP